MKQKNANGPRKRWPVAVSEAHQGKSLEVDVAKETISLIGPSGENLGTVTWAAVIELIQETYPPPRTEARAHPRVSLVIRVRYRTAAGVEAETRASGIGGGGLFIESTSPLPVGTELALEFALPDRPTEWLSAKGAVAWVCPKSDHYTFFPGMGVRFTQIAAGVRERVQALVASLQRTDEGKR
ncbi:MAG: PilZ domain-containing protein [Nitrospirota bacterium]|jgi:uncharacterized protein (TIGR02266 family)